MASALVRTTAPQVRANSRVCFSPQVCVDPSRSLAPATTGRGRSSPDQRAVGVAGTRAAGSDGRRSIVVSTTVTSCLDRAHGSYPLLSGTHYAPRNGRANELTVQSPTCYL